MKTFILDYNELIQQSKNALWNKKEISNQTITRKKII